MARRFQQQSKRGECWISGLAGLALIAGSVVVTGCSSNHRAGRPDRAIDQNMLIASFERSEDRNLYALVDQYYEAKLISDREAIRNEIIDVTMILIDQHHAIFVHEFSAGRKDFDTSMDVGSILTDAAATLVGSASTKAILAAISGSMTATKGVVDKNYFYSQTIQVIIKQMDSTRRKVSVDLVAGTSKSLDAYPLAAALVDLERYYTAGTIDGALSAIQQNASEERIKADVDLLKIRESIDQAITYSDAADLWLDANGIAAGRVEVQNWYAALLADPISNAGEIAAAAATAAELARNNQGLDDASFAAYFPAGVAWADEANWHEFDAAMFFSTQISADSLRQFVAAFESDDILDIK